jgi:hypothetical protein
MTTTITPIQTLEAQNKRVASLQERRTRVQVRLETESTALAAARTEAIAQFGTADLAEIRKQFQDKSAENSRLVAEFTVALDSVDQQLSDIERQIKL